MVVLIVPFVTLGVFGCGSTPNGAIDGHDSSTSSNPVPNPGGSGDQARSAGAAIINATLLVRDDLWDRLAERAGGEVLEEIILERRLDAELRRRGITLTDADVQAEQDSLLFLLMEGLPGDRPDEAERLIDQIRRSRGLGPVGYKAMLRRNAMLRRLVRDDVEITEQAVARLFTVRHGPKVYARIIVLPSEREASELRRTLIADSPAESVEFAEAAMTHSRDATSARGGQIEPFSTSDPVYPASVRQAIDRMNPGELSPVIAIEAGFAILLLERRTEPDGVELEAARPQLMRELRLREERIRMQDLALELVDSTRMTPVDKSLGWSWQRRANER
jgi:hypothetical protein